MALGSGFQSQQDQLKKAIDSLQPRVLLRAQVQTSKAGPQYSVYYCGQGTFGADSHGKDAGSVTGGKCQGFGNEEGKYQEFDLFFTHSLKLHLIQPNTANNKINDIWLLGCVEND